MYVCTKSGTIGKRQMKYKRAVLTKTERRDLNLGLRKAGSAALMFHARINDKSKCRTAIIERE